MNVILASGSPYRQMQLKNLGLPFTISVPAVDENSLKGPNREPKKIAVELAELKGRSVAHSHPDDIIIAADQVAYLDLQILSKPRERARAIAQLEQLQGRTHHLATALWMKHPKKGVRESLIVAKMEMKKLSRQSLERYVDHDSPLDCAGSYKIEGAGLALFDSVTCQDFSSIIGLPLMAVVKILQDWDLPLPFAW